MTISPTLQQRLAARLPDPQAKPSMYQHWYDLLFLHWEFPVDTLQALLPAGLTIDTFEDKAYLGIVPFFMSGIRPRFLPAVPWLSKFQELNVRTYVHDDTGHPGVWFFTLDAANPLAVKIARRYFHLPYRHSRMSGTTGDPIDYKSTPRDGGAESHYTYPRPHLGIEAAPETLEFFLLERYYLFAHDHKLDRLYRGQVAHDPYRFQLTPATKWTATPIAECHLPPPPPPPPPPPIAPGFPVPSSPHSKCVSIMSKILSKCVVLLTKVNPPRSDSPVGVFSSSSTNAVNISVGTRLKRGSSFNAETTSPPSIPGITTSTKISSGANSLAVSTAFLGSFTTATS